MFVKNYTDALILFIFLNLHVYLVAETQQVISIHDISQNEVSKYVEVVEKSKGLFSLVEESFHFDVHTYRDITDQELQIISERISDNVLKTLASQTVLVGENGVKYGNRTSDKDIGFKTAFIAFRRNSNGKYDVVYCTAEQTREINWKKIGYTTVISGGVALAVSAAMPGVGLVIGGIVVGTAACLPASLGYYQNYFEMQNVVIGYIGKELADRKLLLLK